MWRPAPTGSKAPGDSWTSSSRVRGRSSRRQTRPSYAVAPGRDPPSTRKRLSKVEGVLSECPAENLQQRMSNGECAAEKVRRNRVLKWLQAAACVKQS